MKKNKIKMVFLLNDLIDEKRLNSFIESYLLNKKIDFQEVNFDTQEIKPKKIRVFLEMS